MEKESKAMFPALESSLCHQTNTSLPQENVFALSRHPLPGSTTCTGSTTARLEGVTEGSSRGEEAPSSSTTAGTGGSCWHQKPPQIPPALEGERCSRHVPQVGEGPPAPAARRWSWSAQLCDQATALFVFA